MNKYIELTFRFNSSHSNVGDKLERHFHTFSMTLTIDYVTKEIENTVVRYINEFLNQFNDKYLDELDYFKGVYPSIETIGDCFFDSIQHLLSKMNVNLLQLSISDSPLKAYLVGDRLMLPNLNDNISNKNFALMMKFLERSGN
ncbi:MAG: 6-carboxytetrahydropterin synthase [Saccharofermentans sp.]|nr:6-carboxytetrahydropterin synthase [Saccharofermentans sp.]